MITGVTEAEDFKYTHMPMMITENNKYNKIKRKRKLKAADLMCGGVKCCNAICFPTHCIKLVII